MIKAGGKVPSSLSASVFDLSIGQRWIWTVVIYSVCFLCLFPFDILPHSMSVLDTISEDTQFLAFIAIAALAFVGAAPLVKDTQDIAYKVHCAGAGICAGASILLLGFNNAWFLFYFLPFVGYEAWRFRNAQKWRTQTFWGEMSCFATAFAYFVYNIYNKV